MPEDSWERRRELTFALALYRGECEFLTGALGQAEQRLEALSSHATNTVERATVAGLRADLYTTLDQGSRAIAVGLDYLRHLGVDWSPHPTREEARREYRRIWSQLGGRTIESLIELPMMSDPASLATLDVLAKIGVPACYTDANMVALITCRAVNLSLERGNCDASCSAYVRLSMIAGPIFGDYRTARYRFGRLGYDLVEKRGLTRFQPRTYMDFGGSVLPWTRPVRAGRDLIRRGVRGGKQDRRSLPCAACCGQPNDHQPSHCGRSALRGGGTRSRAWPRIRGKGPVSRGTVIDAIVAQLGLIRTLRGAERRHSGSLRRSAVQRGAGSSAASQTILTWPSSNAGIGSASCRRVSWRATTPRPSRPRRERTGCCGLRFPTARILRISSLCRAISRRSLQFRGERRTARAPDAIAAHQEQLPGIWAANCPDNFENRAALVAAEMARLEGRTIRGGGFVRRQAIQSARANAFIHQEALAGRASRPTSMRRVGLRTSPICICARRVLAIGFGELDGEGSRQLDELYPNLQGGKARARAGEHNRSAGQTTSISCNRDQRIVAGRLRARSSRTKLIATLMRTAIEQAGAPSEDCWFFLERRRTADRSRSNDQRRDCRRPPRRNETRYFDRDPGDGSQPALRSGEIVILDET